MKHQFLLDVMIVYHAVKGVDEQGNPDLTSSELVRLVGENCHALVADKVLLDRYWGHLSKLFSVPMHLTETALFITQIMLNSAKMQVADVDPPELPPGVKIPSEDEYVVRAALIWRPAVVTAEGRLLKAINSQRDILGLTALGPWEATQLAKET